MKQDIQKIVDFLYSQPDVPSDLIDKIQQWMACNKDNEDVTAAMLDIWNNEYGKNEGEISCTGLERLLSEVRGVVESKPHRKFNLRRIVRYAAVAAVAIAVCAGGYIVGTMQSHDETMLITAQGSTGVFTLPDGSRVCLNSDSRLCYDPREFTNSSERKVKVEGGAYFDVTKDKSHPFVVELNDMEVEVLGTSFEVKDRDYSGLKEVVLLSGKVQVSTASDPKPRQLYPDQRFIYNSSTGDSKIENADAESYCRWIHSRLKLENEPLGELLITVGRKYGVDLSVAPDVDQSQCISITLAKDDLEDIMSAICYLTDLEYDLNGHTLVVRNVR